MKFLQHEQSEMLREASPLSMAAGLEPKTAQSFL